MASPPHSSSSGSSDSVSTDEQLRQEEEIFVELLREAENLLYDNTAEASSRIRSENVERGWVAANERLLNDYFGDNLVYSVEKFRWQFRMSRRLFEQIVNDLEAKYEYFRDEWDARGKKDFSPIQKCTSTIRQLAYGVAAKSLDEYLRLGDKTLPDFLHNFCSGIVELYGRVYFRRPTYTDVQQLYTVHEEYHGFPGMLDSVDCTHSAWANCPVVWRGQFMRGDHEHPTIIVEVVASHDLWIWHAYFGVVVSNNDINVFNQLPIFNDIYDGKAFECPFVVNGVN